LFIISFSFFLTLFLPPWRVWPAMSAHQQFMFSDPRPPSRAAHLVVEPSALGPLSLNRQQSVPELQSQSDTSLVAPKPLNVFGLSKKRFSRNQRHSSGVENIHPGADISRSISRRLSPGPLPVSAAHPDSPSPLFLVPSTPFNFSDLQSSKMLPPPPPVSSSARSTMDNSVSDYSASGIANMSLPLDSVANTSFPLDSFAASNQQKQVRPPSRMLPPDTVDVQYTQEQVEVHQAQTQDLGNRTIELPFGKDGPRRVVVPLSEITNVNQSGNLRIKRSLSTEETIEATQGEAYGRVRKRSREPDLVESPG
jgi:hypothetical protein